MVLASPLPVVVDFWAAWCGPCKHIAPAVEELAREYEGRVSICKCNVDEASEVPLEYGIRSIPTLLFFKDGKQISGLRIVGAVPKSAIAANIENLITL